MERQPIKGVFAAAVTPLRSDYSPDLDQIPGFLEFLAQRGCHGALVLGTTGEGTAFSPLERGDIFTAAARVRERVPDFKLLAGTGTPSLQETIDLNRVAFDQGFDGVVVLPPYYHRDVGEAGLGRWFSEVIDRSVPSDGLLFAYHIPSVSGVPIPTTLLQSLHDRHPKQFSGLKDSSGDPAHAEHLGATFHSQLAVFNGNDRHFGLALEHDAAGCITAPANIISPLLRELWDRAETKGDVQGIQEEISSARSILDRYPPAAPLLKALLAEHFGFPAWPVRPPLMPAPASSVDEALQSLLGGGVLR
ncbi:MAG: dihydrodipicolinate synthase family protein [Anaerolineales bacterium]|nr:dihydrodipicolinate synthase family protein [Anaerolineales bacterium]